MTGWDIMKTPEELKRLHGQQYVDNYVAKQSPYRLERLLNYMNLNKSQDVADFACGNGIMMEVVAHCVKSYTGVDFSKEFIAAASRRKETLSITNADFVNSSIEDYCNANSGKFDVCFTMDFSEHVYDKEWISILQHIRKSLKERGVLYLHTPNGDFFLEIIKKRNFIIKQYPQHIAVRSPEENRQLLVEAGFSIKKMELIPHYNFLRALHFLSYFPFFGKHFKARIFIEATPDQDLC